MKSEEIVSIAHILNTLGWNSATKDSSFDAAVEYNKLQILFHKSKNKSGGRESESLASDIIIST